MMIIRYPEMGGLWARVTNAKDTNMFNRLAEQGPMLVDGLDYTKTDENGKPLPITMDITDFKLLQIAHGPDSLAPASDSEIYRNGNIAIDVNSDNVNLQLSELAKQSKTVAHGGFASYDGIDWDALESAFSADAVIRRDGSNVLAEDSIECLAANYALYRIRIKYSTVGHPMGADDMERSLERLETFYESAKQALGERMLQYLDDYLQYGSVHGDYSDLPSAVSEIVDARVEEYTTMYDGVFIVEPRYLTGGTGYFVEMMYSKKYADIRLGGSNTATVRGRYSYAGIKGAFASIVEMRQTIRDFNDPTSIPPSDQYFSQDDLGQIAGFAAMKIAVLTRNAGQSSQLVKDVMASAFNQMIKAAEREGKRTQAYYEKKGMRVEISTDYVAAVMRQYMQIGQAAAFDKNELMKLILGLRPDTKGQYSPYDGYTESLAHRWNTLIKSMNDIDVAAYTFGTYSAYA
jgi:hypothetical protein